MNYSLILGCIATVGLYASAATAKSSAEVRQIAQSITVKIEYQLNGDSDRGSGFIIHKQENLYTIVTNRHVVCKINSTQTCATPSAAAIYLITTADGKQHSVSAKGVKILGKDLDLAIVQFRSSNQYPIAQIDNSASLKADDIVYTSGFPPSKPGFQFSEGQALVVVRKRLTGDRGGYTIGYDAITFPGMSGSAVFDRSGRVIAIHGQGDRYRNRRTIPSFDTGQEGIKVGTNRGIPVEILVSELQKIGIGSNKLSIATVPQNSATIAEEYLLRGYNQWIDANDKTETSAVIAERLAAVQFYSKAIALNPRQAKAHLLRGFAYLQLQKFDLVMNDYNLAIANDAKYAFAYYLRGGFKSGKLKDFQGAISDYDLAISLKPAFAGAYINRATAKLSIGDFQGALSDCDRAIAIEPENPIYYASRVIVKFKLQDSQGARSDLERILTVDLDENGSPRSPLNYYFSGALKKNVFQDRAGARQDLQKAKEMCQGFTSGSLIDAIDLQLKELQSDTRGDAHPINNGF
jgi:tetratricopeptide (TPR) repeat protein